MFTFMQNLLESDEPKREITADNFLKQIEKGIKNFHLIKVTNANLRGLDLNDIVMTQSELRSCDFSQSSLLHANFQETRLKGTNFSGSFLAKSNFYKANLIGCNFSGVHGQGVNLSHANLRGANLTWADLRGVNLAKATLQDVNLSYTNLEGANLGRGRIAATTLNMLRLPAGSRVIRQGWWRSKSGVKQEQQAE
ncbi:pentapeptide repeat-containing protein [Sodalinema gerasimenkoae]|uniref:pentapeptide repeat-containing protein n=1 Tax=Sodalinema gerasimenkoae TaxID=2862348 RepID=UPI001356DC35|nr:pentapeptide repeat-containing protein [Sodalinema gerasimenkoae]